MNSKYAKSIGLILLAILILAIGIILGIITKSNTALIIDEKIRYSEILNWVTTIIIGFIVGYYFKNQYENNKIIKNYLLEDLKNISSQLTSIKTYCEELRTSLCLTEGQRKEIVSRVNILDKKITVFTELLKDCDKSKHSIINETLINNLNRFNRKLTSDGLYENPIQSIYFDEIVAEGAKFESEVRKITLTIIKNM